MSVHKLKSTFRAMMAFVKAWVAPTEPVVAYSENGHPILEGWSAAPEERLLQLFDLVCMNRQKAAGFGLFALEGAHYGTLQLGPQGKSTIGLGPHEGVTITPLKGLPQNFQVSTDERGQWDSKSPFKVNGQEKERSELLDFDEVELAGSKFLYFDLCGEEKYV